MVCKTLQLQEEEDEIDRNGNSNIYVSSADSFLVCFASGCHVEEFSTDHKKYNINQTIFYYAISFFLFSGETN